MSVKTVRLTQARWHVNRPSLILFLAKLLCLFLRLHFLLFLLLPKVLRKISHFFILQRQLRGSLRCHVLQVGEDEIVKTALALGFGRAGGQPRGFVGHQEAPLVVKLLASFPGREGRTEAFCSETGTIGSSLEEVAGMGDEPTRTGE